MNERHPDDRIALVGMACRVPGAPDVAALWRNLTTGADAVRRFTPRELAAAGLSTVDPSWVPAFGYLDGLADFDAALFGYRDEEAALLDPQHRIFLEVAWWALEDAGYDPARTPEQIGVFAGCGPNRYLRHHLLGNPKVLAASDGLDEDWDESLAGGTCDYLPARVAYALGLTGPAVAVQTACSSSLVAVCQAAQSLLDYRCDLAVAGGAAVVSTRQRGYRHRPGGTLAHDGVCRPYDRAASGQVFGNGGGAVVLKRLADAVGDGDHIHAVLAGWAVGNDGADRAGFTVPGVNGQAAVIAEALASAGWEAADLGFVEGHGSGTALGDVIEIEAMMRALRVDERGAPGAYRLGSVKSSVGNLDAAAGVVGLLKAALAVRHGTVPATLHHTAPHPDVSGPGFPFAINTAAVRWPGPRRAGVSSFGQGGTNAHVLVEEAPPHPGPGIPANAVSTRARTAAERAAAPALLLPLSAAGPQALRELARRLAAHLAGPAPARPNGPARAPNGPADGPARAPNGPTDGPAPIGLADVAYTLAVGRRRFPFRAAVSAMDVTDAVAALSTLADGSPVPVAADLRDAAAVWLTDGEVTTGPGRRVPLPGYPFQRRRHWVEPVRR